MAVTQVSVIAVGRRPRPWRWVAAGVCLAAAAALAHVVGEELHSSRWQARWLAEQARELRFEPRASANPALRVPSNGPFDERLGYTRIPVHVQRLTDRGYAVTSQAWQSPALVEHLERGLFAPFHEKTQAGLSVLDCRAQQLYESRYPQQAFGSFDEVPPLLAATLSFVEDRGLLAEDAAPTRNPVIDPARLGRAVFDQILKRVDAEHSAGGGSTLATQIEKYRHSPDGRTAGARDKLRQIASASLRVYADGEDTQAARRRILLDYVNTVPLGALRGWGEVHGLPDGLHAWFGADVDAAAHALRLSAPTGDDLAAQALAYRQALSLIIAQRRPAWYLRAGQAQLHALTDSHLRVLANGAVITPALRDAALATPAQLRERYPVSAAADFAQRKAVNASRVQLAALLDTPRLYDVDRLDLTAATTIDGALQDAVTAALQRLRDPHAAREAGLIGERLLERGDPSRLNYSFTLFERGDGVNRVRVHTDNLDQPFDINAGAKLELGSTAKLRTLATYLDLVASLHAQLAALPGDELAAHPVAAPDRLGRWAVDYLRVRPQAPLAEMLEAAMQRRFSASPNESFFTGGGVHRFTNFDRRDDARVATLYESLRDSLNLPFIRLMREIVQHHIHRGPESAGAVLEQKEHPARAALLARFADREGRQFTRGFYRRLSGKSVEQMLDALAGAAPTPQRLAVIHRMLKPEAGFVDFDAFVERHRPTLPTAQRRSLHDAHAPGRFDLADRGYLARIHPLELEVAAHLARVPGATLAQVIEATAAQRQHAYAWLMRTGAKGAQDRRIRTLIEIDAFEHVHESWRRVGYPFDSLVPSYATAIGSSGDRPAALAELMGIIVAGGVRQPTVQLETLHFAAGTPYETLLQHGVANAPERALAPEVAQVLKAALAQVVEQGTGRRLRGALLDAQGVPLAIGGKTGTGDNRHASWGARGERTGSRVLNRTATFVFFVGEHHFGTLTAFVPGPEAADYRFTSALPTQILKTLAPVVAAAIASPSQCAAESPAAAAGSGALGVAAVAGEPTPRRASP
ncbi:MAG TPA: transglycosylase domain-containing protein [Rubrivivax sp.]|nr:transglycosylase domain-containing protein [Rubrivivax sp.]